MKALDCRRLLGGGGPSASQSKKITFNQLGLRPDHKTSRTHTHTQERSLKQCRADGNKREAVSHLKNVILTHFEARRRKRRIRVSVCRIWGAMRSIFISFCVSVNWLFRIIQQIPPEEGNSIKLVLQLDFINRSFSRFIEERKKEIVARRL